MFDETKNNGENLNTSENISDNSINDAQDIPSSDTVETTAVQAEKIREEAAIEENMDEEIVCEQQEQTIEAAQEPETSTDETVLAQNTDTVVTQAPAENSVTNSYTWNSNPSSQETSKKSEKKPSGGGFKVFVAVMLTVFTLSSMLLVGMVALDLVSDANYSFSINTEGTHAENNEKFDYNSVTLDTPNYVAFDFKDHEGQVLSIPEIAAKCSPSSVGIVSEIETSYSTFFFSSPQTHVAEASGSGFIYSSDGYIVTNHHVIEDATRITVILYDNTEYEATLIGSDALSDIAVLKINPDSDVKLIPMEIGNSDELVVGEAVVAIGCPAGIEFIGTVTDGIVSAINRNVEITDSYGNVQKNMTLIQTNATINHGNSGGPLINTRGQVIGINTLKLSSNYEGVGFSIPMNGAKPIIKQLIEHGEVIERTDDDFAYGKGIIGINGSAISESEAEYYGIPQGVLVVQINRDSSASAAGLRRGDIITHYNGKKVLTVDDINNAKGSARAGTEVTITVYRDGVNNKGETFDITFKLDSQQ